MRTSVVVVVALVSAALAGDRFIAKDAKCSVRTRVETKGGGMKATLRLENVDRASFLDLIKRGELGKIRSQSELMSALRQGSDVLEITVTTEPGAGAARAKDAKRSVHTIARTKDGASITLSPDRDYPASFLDLVQHGEPDKSGSRSEAARPEERASLVLETTVRIEFQGTSLRDVLEKYGQGMDRDTLRLLVEHSSAEDVRAAADLIEKLGLKSATQPGSP